MYPRSDQSFPIFSHICQELKWKLKEKVLIHETVIMTYSTVFKFFNLKWRCE